MLGKNGTGAGRLGASVNYKRSLSAQVIIQGAGTESHIMLPAQQGVYLSFSASPPTHTFLSLALKQITYNKKD